MSAGGASGGQAATAPPTPLPSHAVPPPSAAAGNPLIAAAREQERVYMELLSRPPYNSDPILAQQVRLRMHLPFTRDHHSFPPNAEFCTVLQNLCLQGVYNSCKSWKYPRI